MEDLQPLIRNLGRIEYGANRRAVAALVAIGGRAVPPLCEALEREDPLVRTWAAHALGRIAQHAPIRELRAALPLLYRYGGPWSFEAPASKRVYRVSAQRIDEATSWVRDFPLPAQPPPPSAGDLPAPAVPPPPDG